MNRYMVIIEASDSAFKGLLDNPHDRKEAVEPLFQTIGATVEHYWIGVGSNTLYIVFVAPDNTVDLEAISILVMSSGVAKSMEMRQLMTSGEAVAALRRAADLSYSPPTSD